MTENSEQRCVWKGCERPSQEPEGVCAEHAAFWVARVSEEGFRGTLRILEPHKDLEGAGGDAIREACAGLEADLAQIGGEVEDFRAALRAEVI